MEGNSASVSRLYFRAFLPSTLLRVRTPALRLSKTYAPLLLYRLCK
jgi:hypothetical protein